MTCFAWVDNAELKLTKVLNGYEPVEIVVSLFALKASYEKHADINSPEKGQAMSKQHLQRVQ